MEGTIKDVNEIDLVEKGAGKKATGFTVTLVREGFMYSKKKDKIEKETK
ncbi:MAG: hypothetical protein WAX69_12960 [Victivallales bacterium]